MASELEFKVHELTMAVEAIKGEIKSHDTVLEALKNAINDMTLNLVKIQYMLGGMAAAYVLQSMGLTEFVKSILFK